jgi:hypothetical protein
MQPEGTHSLSLLVHAVMDSCDVPSSVYIIGTGCSRFCTIHTFQQQNSLDDSVPKSARHFFFAVGTPFAQCIVSILVFCERNHKERLPTSCASLLLNIMIHITGVVVVIIIILIIIIVMVIII